jgi:hypothetical protein
VNRTAGAARRTMIAALLAALLAALAVVLAACSGVPGSSEPQVIRPIAGGGPVTPPAQGPEPGDGPREIVLGFLRSNVSSDVRHSAARTFLTPEAQRTWQDTTVTILDNIFVNTFDTARSQLTVTGRQLGRVETDGAYVPELRATSAEADDLPFTFGMVQIDGQWRIDSLSSGLIVSREDFEATYGQYPLYFLDATDTTLVPDVRYSATTGQTLATFLLTNLLDGPRPELQTLRNAVPTQPSTSRPAIKVDTTTDIELVGVRQLPPQELPKVAAQLAYTFSAVSAGPLRIVEGGAPVPVIRDDGTLTRADLPSFGPPPSGSRDIYYIRSGAIVSGPDGLPLPGRAGTGELGLISVAASGEADPWLAAVGMSGGVATLYVGPDGASLQPVALPDDVRPALLTRPTWAGRAGEVWVSDGAQLYRVGRDGSAAAVPVVVRGGGATDARTISAVRMSRDGARVALVYGADGARGLWVGAVARSTNGADARLEALTPITPADYQLTDVAWSDASTLVVIGQRRGSGQPFGIWAVQSDGSKLADRTSAGLPASMPQAITAAPAQLWWISVDGLVWILRGATWTVAGGDSAASIGTSPAYGD